MNSKATYLTLLDIIDGIAINTTNRTTSELVILKNYFKKRYQNNLHIRPKYNLMSSVIINQDESFDTFLVTDYRGSSVVIGLLCNIYNEDY
jgi:hypothetical protein